MSNIHREGLKHQDISDKFNRMDVLGEEGHLDASFIHYAGRGYTNSSLKRETRFTNEFCQLFEGIIADDELVRIKAAGWDLFVDKAQKRYKLPRSVVAFLAEKFVTI